MTLELDKADRQQAIDSIMRYFEQNMDERIGNIAAGGLLSFLVEEVGPLIYNRGVLDAQQRLLARVQEVDLELQQDAFQYWRRHASPAARGRR